MKIFFLKKMQNLFLILAVTERGINKPENTKRNKVSPRSSLMAQWVMDLALSLLWLRLLLWLGFYPWPGNFYMPQEQPKKKRKKKRKKVSPDCSVCASSACASGCSSLKVCEILFYLNYFLFFAPFLFGNWVLFCIIYIYLYIHIYISMCFFLIARSLSLDLVLSKTMTKKLWIVFCNFPHSLFKCGATSAADSPHPHLSNKSSLLAEIHMYHGWLGEDDDITQTVPFLYREVIIDPARGLPIQLCLSVTSEDLQTPPPTLDGAVWLPMKLFNLNAYYLVSLFLLLTFWSLLWVLLFLLLLFYVFWQRLVGKKV